MSKIVFLAGLLAAAGSAGTIQITGLSADGQLLVSDDFFHSPASSWESLPYAISALTGDSPLQYARFLDPDRLDGSIALYEQAALLLNGMRQTGPESLLDLTVQYQYALWSLFAPELPVLDPTVETLLDDSRTAIGIPNADRIDLYSRLRILTPLQGDESGQELLTFSNDPSWLNVAYPDPFPQLAPPSLGDLATPEPAAMILAGIGMGLILVGPLLRRLRRQTAASSKTRTMSR